MTTTTSLPVARQGVGTFSMTEASVQSPPISLAGEGGARLLFELLQHLPACVALYDADGVCLAASAALGRWLGRSCASLVGQPLENVWPGDFVEARKQRLADTLLLGPSEGIEMFPSLLGSERVRVRRFAWTDAGGEPAGVVESFEQPPGLAERAETVGRMALGIAHDFNNALTLVLGQADLMEQSLDRGEAPASSLAELRGALDHACQLPRQLLRFARGKEMTTQLIDLNTLAASIRGLVRPRLRAGQSLRFEPEPSGAWIEGDPAGLTQVLLNLTLNGLDAMPRGGEVVLRIEKVDSSIRLTVRDSGVGMSREVQQRLFEPLYTTRSGGNGLGLCLVRDIVQRHEGRIAWRSAPGVGTVFTLDLPAAEFPNQAPASGEARPRVVIVERDPELARLLGLILTRGGYEPRIFNSLGEVRNQTGEPAQVLVLDAESCPPGSEESRRLRAAHPQAGVVMLTSGPSLPPGWVQASFVGRPFRAGQLLEAVASVLSVTEASRA